MPHALHMHIWKTLPRLFLQMKAVPHQHPFLQASSCEALGRLTLLLKLGWRHQLLQQWPAARPVADAAPLQTKVHLVLWARLALVQGCLALLRRVLQKH